MNSLTSYDLCRSQLFVSILGDILVVITLELHLVLLSVWRLEVDVDLGTLDCVDGPHGAGLVEVKMEIFTSLCSQRLEPLLRVDSHSDFLAVNQLLKGVAGGGGGRCR